MDPQITSEITALLSADSIQSVPESVLISYLMEISTRPSGLATLRGWTFPDKKKNKCLHQLVAYKKMEAVRALVPALDINDPRPSDLLTPLLLSVWKDKTASDVSELLLELGADPTIRSSYGENCEELVRATSTGLQSPKNVAFLDLELTALPNDDGARILEIAILVTDENFKELTRREWQVSHPPSVLSSLSPWHQKEFTSLSSGGNGLFAAVLSPFALPLDVVSSQVLAFISLRCPPGRCKLAGFSVHCDREVLRREMPLVYHYFGHQILDVSTVASLGMTLGKITKGDVYKRGGAAKRLPHRAMADVVFSLQTLKFLNKKLFHAA